MSIARWRNSQRPLNDNPHWIFRFTGSQATSESSGLSNNVWNLETLRNSEILTQEAQAIDIVDFWPQSETQVGVFLNGVWQESDVDFTLTAHTSSTTCSVSFLKNVNAEDRVTFLL